ncbi:JAB domain-containing protein [Holophaga foetida]|uniref:JAB domain-containing protein n=1 Tax=Holophaga foetida TaxID=35839 RepID=UPI0002471737|nr:JAB domain-containing protein [Holophaga foetida]
MTQYTATPDIKSESQEDHLLASALAGVETLSDVQLLATLLEEEQINRAENLLLEAGNLALLANKGPVELMALGLGTREVVRLLVNTELTARLAIHRRARRLGNPAETVEAIRLRALGWDCECVGVIVVDRERHILLDQILFRGTPYQCPADICVVLREVVRTGGFGVVLYRWVPASEVILLAEDRILADRLRLAASALGVEVLDCLLISEQSCWSGRTDGRWL